VGQGVRDSYALIDLFKKQAGGRLKDVYMTGASMGGHVTAVAIEEYPKAFVGAMPICGVLGDAELFDYFLDANVTAAALTGTAITFPQAPVDPSYQEVYRQQVLTELPKLGIGTGTGLTPLGQRWSNVVEQRTGGTRPGFDAAFAYWNAIPSIPPLNTVPFLFGLYPGLSGGTAGIAAGNVTSNRLTLYQTDDNPWLTRDELRLNRDVLRVDRTARPSRGLDGVPKVDGRPPVPTLSMHTVGDLFVPFSMEQEYARRAAFNGRSKLFASRAVRALGHCEFTVPELRQGFDDLVGWVRTGKRAKGDAILDRGAVADPGFGCAYTLSDRPTFGAPCAK
jgi:pimeloyl-ACP methyl ester carboxylesterase